MMNLRGAEDAPVVQSLRPRFRQVIAGCSVCRGAATLFIPFMRSFLAPVCFDCPHCGWPNRGEAPKRISEDDAD